jgi:hypothetical protein
VALPAQKPGNWESSYPVFDSRAESLPEEVSQLLQQVPFALHEERAQHLKVKGPATIWAIPGERRVCLVTQEIKSVIGSTCLAPRWMRSHPLATTLITPPAVKSAAARRFIVGIAPRSAKAVMAYTGKSHTQIPVVRGVFAHQDMLREPPDRVRLDP